MSAKKNVLVAILISGVSILLSLGVLEVALRLLAPEPAKDKKSKYSRDDQPVFPERPDQYFVPTTSTSLRGNLSDMDKASGRYRISVIGDSFTFGPKMQFFDAFPAKLQMLLSLNPKAQTPIEVRSYGTPGAGTRDEVPLVENAIKANSDMVVLEITLNDPQLEPFRKTPTDFQAIINDKNTGFLKRLLCHSQLYRFIRTRIFNSQSYQRYIDYHRDLFANPKTREVFYHSLGSIIALTKEKHIPLVVMVLPLFDFDFKNYPLGDIHKELGEFFNKEQIPFLDMLPRFAGTDNTRLQVVPAVDNHPNEIAHRIIAETLYEFLLSDQLSAEAYSGLSFRFREAVFEREHPQKIRLADGKKKLP